MSPSGEVSGLAYGDRKFNMIGKGKNFFIFSLWMVLKKWSFCRNSP